MTPFQTADLPPEAFDVEWTMNKFGLTREQAENEVKRMARQKIWMNDTYQVNIMELPGDRLHLSIKRRDKLPIHDWRDLQRIKNELVGPENEAVELYPAESRLVDAANQYHLWASKDPTFRFPLGYNTRLVQGPEEAEAVGGRQRAFAAPDGGVSDV
jgi:hypothetical protein